MRYSALLAARAAGLRPSPIRKIAPLMRLPGMISLGGGYPNPQTFAFESVTVGFREGKSLRIDGPTLAAACQYAPTDCHPPLKPLLQRWHCAKDGVDLGDDSLLVLNGSQEGLHIAAYLLLDPGDSVVISEPAYPGALAAFRAFTDRFLPVPVDQDGTDTHELERILARIHGSGGPMPKLVYEVPNGHNPAGVSLSLERRKHLLDIAQRFDLLILEDDPYQLLQLEDRPPIPTLQSLDRSGHVLRLDSFSKIFAPGLRIGYASGPTELIRAFELYKQGTNLHTSTMAQALLAGFLELHPPEQFRALIRNNCQVYRDNRDAMLDAARQFLPSSVRYHVPREGMFVWFELPPGFDSQRMVETDGTELGVLLVPGPAFSTTGGLRNGMRASFSMATPDALREGMRRFAVMIDREAQRVRAATAG